MQDYGSGLYDFVWVVFVDVRKGKKHMNHETWAFENWVLYSKHGTILVIHSQHMETKAFAFHYDILQNILLNKNNTYHQMIFLF